MHIPFRQIPIAAANDRCDNPGIGTWLVLKSPKHSQALKYVCFVTKEVGILCHMKT